MWVGSICKFQSALLTPASFMVQNKKTVHTWKLTWNLNITKLKKANIFQTSMLGFHINFPGCIMRWQWSGISISIMLKLLHQKDLAQGSFSWLACFDTWVVKVGLAMLQFSEPSNIQVWKRLFFLKFSVQWVICFAGGCLNSQLTWLLMVLIYYWDVGAKSSRSTLKKTLYFLYCLCFTENMHGEKNDHMVGISWQYIYIYIFGVCVCVLSDEQTSNGWQFPY